jgi:hypothetical protein
MDEEKTETIFFQGQQFKVTPEQKDLVRSIEDFYLPWAAVQADGGEIPDEVCEQMKGFEEMIAVAFPDGHTAQLLKRERESEPE